MKRVAKGVMIFFATIIGLYFIGTFYFKNRFPAKVYVNQVNIGGMTLKKADEKLSNTDLWNTLKIKSDTEEFLEINSEDIDYKYITTPDLKKIFKEENGQNWLLAMFNESEYTAPIAYEYNKDKLQNLIDSIKAFDRELIDASIEYSSTIDKFIIKPDSYEFKIDKDQLFELVDASIEKKEDELNINEHIKQPEIFQDDKDLIASRDKANEYLNLQLRYDFGDRKELLDGSIIKDFIDFEGREMFIDREKVKDYIAEVARKYDTFGRNRRFRTSLGENIITNGGSYGWLIHRGKTIDALIEYIEAGENQTIEPVYSYKALIRNEDDIGNSYVEIDLKNQMVYVYIDGSLKIKTETVTGNLAKGQATPTGVFPINYKETDAILTGEDYASPVKYWMPFNKDIGLHDADWRDTFGGNIYQIEGSNGCVNLPPGVAKNIFDLVYPGMPVIVH